MTPTGGASWSWESVLGGILVHLVLMDEQMIVQLRACSIRTVLQIVAHTLSWFGAGRRRTQQLFGIEVTGRQCRCESNTETGSHVRASILQQSALGVSFVDGILVPNIEGVSVRLLHRLVSA